MHPHDSHREGLQDAMVEFLAENPGSFRREIVEAMHDLGYSNYAIDKIMNKCKKDNLIVREGNTQNARWSTK
jgi:Holliday junction resolvasome RuvABC DNA-binding subunit